MSYKVIMSTLLLVASTVACYDWRTEPLSPAATTTLAGRMARVILVDGRKLEAVDPRIARDTLFARSAPDVERRVGKPLVVPIAQIARIETRDFNPGRTTAFTVGLVAITAVAAYIILVNSLSFDLGCWPACN